MAPLSLAMALAYVRKPEVPTNMYAGGLALRKVFLCASLVCFTLCVWVVVRACRKIRYSVNVFVTLSLDVPLVI